MGRCLVNTLIFFSAAAAICSQFLNNDDLYSILKPLTTILIITVAIVFGKRDAKKYFYAIIVALLFCLLGDILLLNDSYFIFGLASFLMGHLVFSYGFISISGFLMYLRPLLVLLAVGIAFYGFIYSGLENLFVVVGVYILVILFMCWQGVNLYIKYRSKVFLMVAIAVTLFLISDALLAYDKFVTVFKYSGVFILATYWLAIALLANTTRYIQCKKTDNFG